jgi:hypothetical protein
MNMLLHSIPHQKGEYHGLRKPYPRNVEVEKVVGQRVPPGSKEVLHGEG